MTVIDNQKKETEETNLLDYVGWLPENDPPPRSSRNLSIIMKHSRFYFSVSVCIIATIMFYLERGTWDEGQAGYVRVVGTARRVGKRASCAAVGPGLLA